MERKLIKQGGGGYTIYLPKKWVEGKGLKSGDEVNVIEKDTSLVVQTHARRKSEKIIKLNDTNRHDLKNLMTHAYRRGFDVINIEGLNEANQRELKSVVNMLLLGFEITQKTGNTAIVDNISEPTDKKFDAIMQRLFFINQETIKVLIEDSMVGKWVNVSEMAEIKSNHDRFLLFCRRLLTKEYQEANSVLLWELLTFLQNIEHECFYLYEYLSESKPKIDKNTISLLYALGEYFESFSKAYIKKDIEMIHLINEKKKKYHFGACLKALENSKGKENVVLSYIREIFRLIQVGTSPILGMILEKD